MMDLEYDTRGEKNNPPGGQGFWAGRTALLRAGGGWLGKWPLRSDGGWRGPCAVCFCKGHDRHQRCFAATLLPVQGESAARSHTVAEDERTVTTITWHGVAWRCLCAVSCKGCDKRLSDKKSDNVLTVVWPRLFSHHLFFILRFA